MPLIAVVIIMSSIFSFSVGKIVYDPTIKTDKVTTVSQLDKVYDVASTHIDVVHND